MHNKIWYSQESLGRVTVMHILAHARNSKQPSQLIPGLPPHANTPHIKLVDIREQETNFPITHKSYCQKVAKSINWTIGKGEQIGSINQSFVLSNKY
jgi:hypothetical protein